MAAQYVKEKREQQLQQRASQLREQLREQPPNTVDASAAASAATATAMLDPTVDPTTPTNETANNYASLPFLQIGPGSNMVDSCSEFSNQSDLTDPVTPKAADFTFVTPAVPTHVFVEPNYVPIMSHLMTAASKTDDVSSPGTAMAEPVETNNNYKSGSVINLAGFRSDDNNHKQNVTSAEDNRRQSLPVSHAYSMSSSAGAAIAAPNCAPISISQATDCNQSCDIPVMTSSPGVTVASDENNRLTGAIQTSSSISRDAMDEFAMVSFSFVFVCTCTCTCTPTTSVVHVVRGMCIVLV